MTDVNVFNVFVVTQRNREYVNDDMDKEVLIEENEFVIGVFKSSEGAFDAMHEGIKKLIKEDYRYLFDSKEGTYLYGVWAFDDITCVYKKVTYNVEMMCLKD